ncbi:hypothetical protein [Poseidonibacter lekithochrous]|uniref:hypothetical protein n=1 Tax=Poseidonibacter lekithochrous TaxID=1904463 RepID=UPI000D378306|nr:hypothetical protein [Poseidonibacter lekithochrous]
MKDIVNSFKAHLYERTSSPLIGAFIFYWVVCNYKLVMIILDGDMKVNEKFDLIKTLYPQNIWTPWEGFDIHYSTLLGNGLLMPLIITLIYIFIIPYPSKFIYKFSRNRERELQEINQETQDKIPLTIEQSKKIKEDFKNLEEKYYSNLLKSNKTNDTTNKQNIYSLSDGFTEKKDEEINDNSVINEYQKDILLHLAAHPNSHLSASLINNEFEEIKAKTDYYLEELVDKNFIIRDYDNNLKENTYCIYQKGREYLVKNKLF